MSTLLDVDRILMEEQRVEKLFEFFWNDHSFTWNEKGHFFAGVASTLHAVYGLQSSLAQEAYMLSHIAYIHGEKN